MSSSRPVINDPLDLLDKDKAIFKKKLESAIRDLVKNTSRNECVALVRKHKASSELGTNEYKNTKLQHVSKSAKPIIKRDGEQWVCEWQVRMFHSDAHVWVACFIAMILHRDIDVPTFEETELDSCLSNAITERVQEVWIEFLQEREYIISEEMIKLLLSDSVMTEKLVEQVVSSLRAAGKCATDELQGHVKKHLKENLVACAIHGGSTLAGKAITAILGKTLAHALAVGMSKILAHKTLIGIAKTALLTVMGKMAVQKALVMLAKSAVASIGISLTGGALVKFLLPFVLAFAFYELHEFPRKLGEKIAPTVADAVMGSFRANNKSLLERLYNEKVKSNLKELANTLAGTEHFTEQIMENMVALDTTG